MIGRVLALADRAADRYDAAGRSVAGPARGLARWSGAGHRRWCRRARALLELRLSSRVARDKLAISAQRLRSTCVASPEFVLRHRRLVGLTWLVVVIAGVALVQKTNDRLVIDFSLPGNPAPRRRTRSTRSSTPAARPRRTSSPSRMPAGQTVTGHEAEVGHGVRRGRADRCRTPGSSTRPTPATRPSAPRTTAPPTRMFFYRFLHDPTAQAARPTTSAPR